LEIGSGVRSGIEVEQSSDYPGIDTVEAAGRFAGVGILSEQRQSRVVAGEKIADSGDTAGLVEHMAVGMKNR
jgi:hypothetical protein